MHKFRKVYVGVRTTYRQPAKVNFCSRQESPSKQKTLGSTVVQSPDLDKDSCNIIRYDKRVGEEVKKDDIVAEISSGWDAIKIRATANGVIDKVFAIDGSDIICNQDLFRIRTAQHNTSVADKVKAEVNKQITATGDIAGTSKVPRKSLSQQTAPDNALETKEISKKKSHIQSDFPLPHTKIQAKEQLLMQADKIAKIEPIENEFTPAKDPLKMKLNQMVNKDITEKTPKKDGIKDMSVDELVFDNEKTMSKDAIKAKELLKEFSEFDSGSQTKAKDVVEMRIEDYELNKKEIKESEKYESKTDKQFKLKEKGEKGLNQNPSGNVFDSGLKLKGVLKEKVKEELDDEFDAPKKDAIQAKEKKEPKSEFDENIDKAQKTKNAIKGKDSKEDPLEDEIPEDDVEALLRNALEAKKRKNRREVIDEEDFGHKNKEAKKAKVEKDSKSEFDDEVIEVQHRKKDSIRAVKEKKNIKAELEDEDEDAMRFKKVSMKVKEKMIDQDNEHRFDEIPLKVVQKAKPKAKEEPEESFDKEENTSQKRKKVIKKRSDEEVKKKTSKVSEEEEGKKKTKRIFEEEEEVKKKTNKVPEEGVRKKTNKVPEGKVKKKPNKVPEEEEEVSKKIGKVCEEDVEDSFDSEPTPAIKKRKVMKAKGKDNQVDEFDQGEAENTKIKTKGKDSKLIKETAEEEDGDPAKKGFFSMFRYRKEKPKEQVQDPFDEDVDVEPRRRDKIKAKTTDLDEFSDESSEVNSIKRKRIALKGKVKDKESEESADNEFGSNYYQKPNKRTEAKNKESEVSADNEFGSKPNKKTIEAKNKESEESLDTEFGSKPNKRTIEAKEKTTAEKMDLNVDEEFDLPPAKKISIGKEKATVKQIDELIDDEMDSSVTAKKEVKTKQSVLDQFEEPADDDSETKLAKLRKLQKPKEAPKEQRNALTKQQQKLRAPSGTKGKPSTQQDKRQMVALRGEGMQIRVIDPPKIMRPPLMDVQFDIRPPLETSAMYKSMSVEKTLKSKPLPIDHLNTHAEIPQNDAASVKEEVFEKPPIQTRIKPPDERHPTSRSMRARRNRHYRRAMKTTEDDAVDDPKRNNTSIIEQTFYTILTYIWLPAEMMLKTLRRFMSRFR